ncbi:hypothetical protein HID58_058685 [Brassica napus]|uniref:Uncharacterized protein n=1 Tax=Brassica napus TaxID=3708 RepID=A0ABQ7ZQT7_BRANA|nr:hypothetical protein HID58_058685 [Brassica napus]
MALGAMDLLLDADCARIWVRSEIRDPPEASTCHDRPRLCSAVSPQSIDFSGGFRGVPQRRIVSSSPLSSSSKGSPASRSSVLLLCFISPSKAPVRLLFCNLVVFAASSVSRSGMRP